MIEWIKDRINLWLARRRQRKKTQKWEKGQLELTDMGVYFLDYCKQKLAALHNREEFSIIEMYEEMLEDYRARMVIKFPQLEPEDIEDATLQVLIQTLGRCQRGSL